MAILKAVIGANYGDEGKGYLTDCLCAEALREGKSVIVVCSNGGAQRGHTVENDSGERFVFHHLGSGSLRGVNTFFCSDFILNPMLFLKDWEAFLKLRENDSSLPSLMVDPACRFSTPYDMIINQVFEDARGIQRHGSVGIGIWETVRRYEKGFGKSIYEMEAMNPEDQRSYLKKVRDYASKRIESHLGTTPENMEGWSDIWLSEDLIDNYLASFRDMVRLMSFASADILGKYDVIVVENAQGVLLTQDRYNGTNHTTPSDTGAKQIRRMLDSGLKDLVSDVELKYVTRSYLTKHGAGDFPGECTKDELCPEMHDLTNVPNEYQGTLRYGRLDPEALFKTIEEDRTDMGSYPHSASLLITHLNEVSADKESFLKMTRERNMTLYVSDGRTESFYAKA